MSHTTLSALAFPADLAYHVEHQTWARLDADGTATVGITSLGIQLSCELYMCRPRPVGAEVAQGRSIGVVELAKSVVSIKSPVSGTVIAVNMRLEDTPELVHRDPYGDGWLARLALTDPTGDLHQLVQGDAVVPAMAHHAWLNRQP